MTRRTFLQLSAAALVTTPALAAETPRKGGTLRVGVDTEAVTMDPHLKAAARPEW